MDKRVKGWVGACLVLLALGLLAGCGSGVTLALPGDMVAELGQTTLLEPELLQGKKPLPGEEREEILAGLIWETSDAAVAFVDEEGLLTCVGPGTAEIQAKSGDGRLKAAMTVEVIVPLQRADAPDSLVVPLGGSRDLGAVPVPAEATGLEVRYTTSDAAVAEIDEEGQVTGVAQGTCQVTMVLTGETLIGRQEFGYSTTVTVTSPLDELGFVMTEGYAVLDDEWKVETYHSPASTPVELRFSSSDEEKALFVQEGVVYFRQEGNVTLRVEDLISGRSAEVMVYVSARGEATTWDGGGKVDITASEAIPAPVVIQQEREAAEQAAGELDQEMRDMEQSMIEEERQVESAIEQELMNAVWQ